MRFKLMYFAITVGLFLSLGLALERPAYAYVDPGSGLLVYQSLGAAFTGTLYYFRRRLKALFLRNPAGSDDGLNK